MVANGADGELVSEDSPQQSDAAGRGPGALVGVRLIELGTLLAGPFAGRLLGDMGAEVIKI